MKKSFLMLGLAVAAMSSCTNDEVIDMNQSNQKAIGFESFVNKGTRAAGDVTIDNLSKIYVFGYDNGGTDGANRSVFENDLFKKSNGFWVIDTISDEKNWEPLEYEFAAYADGPSSSQLTAGFEDETLSISDYSTEDQLDLIAALTDRNNSSYFDISAVDLDFKHLLSKVSFTFQNTDTANLSMTVSDVTLNFINEGDCSYSVENGIVWTPTANSITDIELTGFADIRKDIISDTTEVSFVIPQQTDLAKATITFNVVFKNITDNLPTDIVEQFSMTLSLFPEVGVEGNKKALTWEPGYIYNYNVQLPASPKPIQFKIDGLEGWKTETVTLDGGNGQKNPIQ